MSNPFRSALERIARWPEQVTHAGVAFALDHVRSVAETALAAQEPAGNTDAERFRWWFNRPARLSRTLDEWRAAIDTAMDMEEDADINTKLRAMKTRGHL